MFGGKAAFSFETERFGVNEMRKETKGN